MNERYFTPDAFVQAYTGFVKEMQALQSKPLFLLVSPIYSASQMVCMNQLNMTMQPFKLNELDGNLFYIQKTSIPSWNHSMTDMRTLIAKVAEQTGIPW